MKIPKPRHNDRVFKTNTILTFINSETTGVYIFSAQFSEITRLLDRRTLESIYTLNTVPALICFGTKSPRTLSEPPRWKL